MLYKVESLIVNLPTYFFVAVKNIIELKIDIIIFFFVPQKSILTLLYLKRIVIKPTLLLS